MENPTVQDMEQQKKYARILICGHVGSGKNLVKTRLIEANQILSKCIISQYVVSLELDIEPYLYEKLTATDVAIFVIN
jgi:type II secretory pathway predicted ATPase ExeA